MAKRRKEREISMRKVREILRLGLTRQLSDREIARSLCVSHITVARYIALAEKAALTYDNVQGIDDTALLRLLEKDKAPLQKRSYPEPDWNYIHAELKKKSVTLELLWQEYKSVYSEGYQHTQFCELYSRWRRKLNPSMYQIYKAGEKMFVDYAGQTVPIHDRQTGKIRQSQIFVAVLGASNYTYSEATWDQSLLNWIGSHVRTFEYFEGVAKATIIDNLRSGVSKASRYEPDLNPTYHDMAVHYGTVVMPARAGKPKDKAKVESGVLIVERWILAALRNRIFFSLEELNHTIRELLVKLNKRPFKKLQGCRREWFERLEKPALMKLPGNPYVFAQWKKATVNIDYHIEVNGHYYSVPCSLIHQKLDVRYTAKIVDIFFKANLVASHVRNDTKGRHTTVRDHMPKSHQAYMEWTPSRIINWAKTIGPSVAEVAETILNSRAYPEQGYRSCLGILRLDKRYPVGRLDAACKRAISIGGFSYKSIESILKTGLDLKEVIVSQPQVAIMHENVRGSDYFNGH